MRSSVDRVHGLVESIVPFDELESTHRLDTLRWLERTDDVFRRKKPATPPRHLVSYVALTDPSGDRVLLVDHVNARLWLPPGGHVEPDEGPAEAARRELSEELGILETRIAFPDLPMFVTVTKTVGIDQRATLTLAFGSTTLHRPGTVFDWIARNSPTRDGGLQRTWLKPARSASTRIWREPSISSEQRA